MELVRSAAATARCCLRLLGQIGQWAKVSSSPDATYFLCRPRAENQDAAFRTEAVRRVQDGQSAAGVSLTLGLSPSVLARWLAHARRPVSVAAEQELAAETRRLRAALAVAEQERDSLRASLNRLAPDALRLHPPPTPPRGPCAGSIKCWAKAGRTWPPGATPVRTP